MEGGAGGMILVDAFDVQDLATRRFFATRFIGFARGGGHGPSRYEPLWHDSPFDCGLWQKRADIERMLETNFEGKPDQDRAIWAIRIPSLMFYGYENRGWGPVAEAKIDSMFVRIERAPCCGCCGANPWGRDRPQRPVIEAAPDVWRCEKHIGRNPCAIEGCGKTRACNYYASDNYLCGAHWKRVPYALKAIYRRHWRIAKANRRRLIGDEQGFTDPLTERYWRNWYRLVRETRLIVHPPAVEVEVLPSSGPPPTAMLRELERMGL